jgi:hypothetical protein
MRAQWQGGLCVCCRARLCLLQHTAFAAVCADASALCTPRSWHTAPSNTPVQQLAARHELRHDVHLAPRDVHGIQLDAVGVVDLRCARVWGGSSRVGRPRAGGALVAATLCSQRNKKSQAWGRPVEGAADGSAARRSCRLAHSLQAHARCCCVCVSCVCARVRVCACARACRHPPRAHPPCTAPGSPAPGCCRRPHSATCPPPLCAGGRAQCHVHWLLMPQQRLCVGRAGAHCRRADTALASA